MFVALETRVTCPSCSYKIRFTAFATVRVNKRRLEDHGQRRDARRVRRLEMPRLP